MGRLALFPFIPSFDRFIRRLVQQKRWMVSYSIMRRKVGQTLKETRVLVLPVSCLTSPSLALACTRGGGCLESSFFVLLLPLCRRKLTTNVSRRRAVSCGERRREADGQKLMPSYLAT